jgi:hypothetical protein
MFAGLNGINKASPGSLTRGIDFQYNTDLPVLRQKPMI